METGKLAVRRKALSAKADYTTTKNAAHLIRAAIYKGVYAALGGRATIILPQEYTHITLWCKAFASVVPRLSGDVIKDVATINSKMISGDTTIPFEIAVTTIGVSPDLHVYARSMHIYTLENVYVVDVALISSLLVAGVIGTSFLTRAQQSLAESIRQEFMLACKMAAL